MTIRHKTERAKRLSFLIPKTKRMKRGGGCGKSTKPKNRRS
nr:MAG TPA: hypothetical protein [Caudoviricetes sp.]